MTAQLHEEEPDPTVDLAIEELVVQEQIIPTLIPDVLREDDGSLAENLEESLEDAINDDEQSCNVCGSLVGVRFRKSPIKIGQESRVLEPLCDECEMNLKQEV